MILRADGIRKTLGGRTILDDAAIALRAGQAAALEGANGAGKTTLLKILAGLLRPDSCANFEVAGEPDGRWRRWNGAVYVHQTPHMFLATAAGNVEYGLRRRGMGREEARSRALAALEWAGVRALADAPAWRLSGGEARRVALARAAALRPRLYLLDEPTAHLDDDGARRVAELTTKLQAEGASVLIATHDSVSFCDRRLRLEKGKITERAPPNGGPTPANPSRRRPGGGADGALAGRGLNPRPERSTPA